ncbi:hypothetical protein [Nocardiopsis sp. NPDC006938]|uniref:hypothetical protein n=1 Tax=Nocardiopsis sp. NPDC006938 TaxID=3364337 RepID=UPI0036967E49
MDTEAALPPILVLGTSERVGSNWVLDSMRHATTQHNEPLRQQLGRDHPLAPLTSAPPGAARSPLATYWVEVFRRSKYHGGRHILKETNLYFTAAPFLDMFPDAPVVVLSRSPLGVASSFTRGGLWGRWGYSTIYRRIVAMTQDDERFRWSELVPDDDPYPPVALTRLIVLNAALLAEALSGREYAHVSYEAAVLDRRSAMSPLAETLPDVDVRSTPGPSHGPVAVDDTFATTTSKSELVARLRPGSADLVVTETARCLSLVRDITVPEAAKTVRSWLGGANAYRQATVITSDTPTPRPPTTQREPSAPTPAYVHSSAETPRWRNVLVSNAEMVEFLNELVDAGFSTTRDGVNLLAVPMPHERGGRLHPSHDGWIVSPGYEHHPAYWVTWLGAAAYALLEGARLPTADELDWLTIDTEASNADYRVGDVTPVTEPGVTADAVHHRVGNVQSWCGDGPDDEPDWAPVTRYLHGAAWNTPGSRVEVVRRRSRTLLGASRGVGVRLVRDAARRHGCPPREIADRLNRWVAALGDRGRLPAELDREAITLLS